MNVKIKARGKLKILLPLIFSVLIAGVAYAEDEERQADPIQQDKLEAGKEGLFSSAVSGVMVLRVSEMVPRMIVCSPSRGTLPREPSRSDGPTPESCQEIKTSLTQLHMVFQVRPCRHGLVF